MKLLIESRPFCVFDRGPMETLINTPSIEIVDMRGAGIEDPDFVEVLKSVDAVLSGNDLVIDEALFGMAPKLKVIAKMGVGLDMIDIDAASRHGAIVFNTPGVNNQAVADHTFAMLLAVARRIIYCDRSLREKRWEHTRIMGIELWQKTLGIVGLGAIGRAVALRAKGFDMNIVAHDPYWPDQFAAENRIERVLLEALLKMSDVISLHVPLTAENKGMINASTLELMKPTAILINAARGEIVNETDLYRALKDGVIAGAGLDVFENEPPTESPLLELDNVVLTPHTAAFTTEAMNNMNVGVVEQLIDYLDGKRPAHLVNAGVYARHQC
ncbi:MAG: hydroxyacid dehydrogenase [Thermodesulfobacteriota bacterium]|nr:hydroxyacid dehydrogenase [Thermodesulfobacteriota bacterium]